MQQQDTWPIRPHDELRVEPRPEIPLASIQRDNQEEQRRGRDVNVWAVTPSKGGDPYHVTYHLKARTYYCTCEGGKRGNICKHVRSVAFLRTYNETYRLYHTATLAELVAQDETLARMEAGRLVPIRGWRAAKAAIGELVRERTEWEAA